MFNTGAEIYLKVPEHLKIKKNTEALRLGANFRTSFLLLKIIILSSFLRTRAFSSELNAKFEIIPAPVHVLCNFKQSQSVVFQNS